MFKHCSDCDTEKSVADFYRSGKYYQKRCKPCHNKNKNYVKTGCKKSKLSDERKNSIRSDLVNGHYAVDVASKNSINYQTFMSWCKQGVFNDDAFKYGEARTPTPPPPKQYYTIPALQEIIELYSFDCYADLKSMLEPQRKLRFLYFNTYLRVLPASPEIQQMIKKLYTVQVNKHSMQVYNIPKAKKSAIAHAYLISRVKKYGLDDVGKSISKTFHYMEDIHAYFGEGSFNIHFAGYRIAINETFFKRLCSELSR